MSGDAGFQGDKVTPAHSPPAPPPCSSVALASFPRADMGRDPPGRWHPSPPSCLLHLLSTLSLLFLLWTSQRPPDVFPGPSHIPPSLSSSLAQKCAEGPALLRAHPRLLTAPEWSPSSWPLQVREPRGKSPEPGDPRRGFVSRLVLHSPSRASVSLCVNVGAESVPITGPLGGPEELACGKGSAITGSHRGGAI